MSTKIHCPLGLEFRRTENYFLILKKTRLLIVGVMQRSKLSEVRQTDRKQPNKCELLKKEKKEKLLSLMLNATNCNSVVARECLGYSNVIV